MITGEHYLDNGRYMGAEQLAGLSTDEKPVSCGNGSVFIEMDTSKIYFFDAAGAQWLEWGAKGGDVPAGYVVVAPEQEVTITAEDEHGVNITSVEGWVFGDDIPNNLLVTIDGKTAEYVSSDYEYIDEVNMIGYIVHYAALGDDPYDVHFVLEVLDGESTQIPGTYTVVIYAPESEG